MATVDWPVSIDSTTIHNNGNLGNTVDQHHPIGDHASSSSVYRAFMKFTLTNLADMVTITSAILWMKSSPQVHITYSGGAASEIDVRRLTSTLNNTQGGSSEGTWSSSASPDGGSEPSTTTSGQVTGTNMTGTSNTWDSVDITAIAQAWLAGSTNYGIRVSATDESSGDRWEFYSKDSAYDPYIRVTYTTNASPSAPTGLAPTTRQVTVDPTFSFTHVDSDGDAFADWDLDVVDATAGYPADFTAAGVSTGVSLRAQTAGIVGNDVDIAYETARGGSGFALVRGHTYYWRARTSASAPDAGVEGAWCATQTFVVNSLPTVSFTDPSATGQVAHLVYTAGSGWAAPRLYTAFDYADAEGDVQTKYEVEVYASTTPTASGGAATGADLGDGEQTSALEYHTSTLTLTADNYYFIRVRVYDGYEYSAWSSYFETKAVWATSLHRKDVSIGGSAPTSWDVTTLDSTTGASNSVVVEYGSTTTATTVTTWYSSLAAVTKDKYVHYRAWLLAWGAASPTKPTLNALTITCSGLAPDPDVWLPDDITSVGGSIDVSTRAFGTQSLKIAGDGTSRVVYQSIPVNPNTDYVLQARIKSTGNSGAVVVLSDSATGSTPLLTVDAATADQEWTYLNSDSYWNSGSRSSIYVCCIVTGAAATAGYFDGIKVESGRVQSPWTPGFVGAAVTVDAGGLQVDAYNSGIFRLRGSTGGADDLVQLGDNGLVLGSGEARIKSVIRVAKRRLFR